MKIYIVNYLQKNGDCFILCSTLVMLCCKSHPLRQYFASFGWLFAFFSHMAQMQGGHLHEGNTNMEESECETVRGNSEQEGLQPDKTKRVTRTQKTGYFNAVEC